MGHLTVGDSFKIGVGHNASIGYSYELVENQDGDYLEISEPVLTKLNNYYDDYMERYDTLAEYTVFVKEAGSGNITFKPHQRRGYMSMS